MCGGNKPQNSDTQSQRLQVWLLFRVKRQTTPDTLFICLCVCASQSLASYHFIKLFSFGSREKNNQVGNVDFHGYSLGCWKCSICLLNMNPINWGWKQNPAHTASLLPFISFYKGINELLWFTFIWNGRYLPVCWGISAVDKSFAFHKAQGEVTFLCSGSHVTSASRHSLWGSLNNPLSSISNCRGNHQPTEKYFLPFILRAVVIQCALSITCALGPEHVCVYCDSPTHVCDVF